MKLTTSLILASALLVPVQASAWATLVCNESKSPVTTIVALAEGDPLKFEVPGMRAVQHGYAGQLTESVSVNGTEVTAPNDKASNSMIRILPDGKVQCFVQISPGPSTQWCEPGLINTFPWKDPLCTELR